MKYFLYTLTKKISQINGNLLRRVLIPSLLNNLLDFVFL